MSRLQKKKPSSDKRKKRVVSGEPENTGDAVAPGKMSPAKASAAASPAKPKPDKKTADVKVDSK